MNIYRSVILQVLVPTVLQATVIVANTGPQINSAGLRATTDRLAVNFISPSASTTITDVALYLGNSGFGTPDANLSLYSDSAGLPGTQLASLGTQSFTTLLPATFTFTPGSAVGLAASTSYWLVLDCSNCQLGANMTIVDWMASSSVTVAGLSGASIPSGSKTSANSGASWSAFTNTVIFSVNGDAGAAQTPEPGSIGLLGFGLAALCLRGRMKS